MIIRPPTRYVIRTILAFFIALLLVLGIFSFFQPQDVSLAVRDLFGIDDKPEQVAKRLCKAIRSGNLPAFLDCCSADAIHQYQLKMCLVNGDARPADQLLKDCIARNKKLWGDCMIEVEQATYNHSETEVTATVGIHVVEKKKRKVRSDYSLKFARNKTTHRWECMDGLF